MAFPSGSSNSNGASGNGGGGGGSFLGTSNAGSSSLLNLSGLRSQSISGSAEQAEDSSFSPRSKLVTSYRALLSGEQPWITSSASSAASGKRRAAPRDTYLSDLLTVPLPSSAQLAQLFHSLLPPASSNTAYALIDDDPNSAGARIRDTISGLWAHAVALWLASPLQDDDSSSMGRRAGRSGSGRDDDNMAALSSPLRLNAVQTLLALSSVILSQRFPNHTLDLINVFAGSISEADDLFIQLVVGIDDVLSEDFPRVEHDSPELDLDYSSLSGAKRGMRPAQHLHLQHMTVQLVLLWLSYTSHTSLGTYFLRRDLFLSLTSFLERSPLTSRFGFEIGLAIGLLAGVGQQGGSLGMSTHSKRASLSIAHGAGPNPLSSSHPYIRHLALWYASASSGGSRSARSGNYVPRPGIDTLILVGAVAFEKQGWRAYTAVQPDGEESLLEGEGGDSVTYMEAGTNAMRAIVGAPIKGVQVIGDEVMQLSETLVGSLRWMVGGSGSTAAGSSGSGGVRSASEFSHLPTAPAAYLLPLYLFSRSNPHFIHSTFYTSEQSSSASRRPSKPINSTSPTNPDDASPAPIPPPQPDLPVSILSFASYLLTHASVAPPSSSAAGAEAYSYGNVSSSRTNLIPRSRAYARLMLCLLWIWLSSEVGEKALLRAEPVGTSGPSASAEGTDKEMAATSSRVGRVRRCKQREHVGGGGTGSAASSSRVARSSSNASAGSSFLPSWATFGRTKVEASATTDADGGATLAGPGDGPRLIGCLLDVCGAYVRNNVSLRLDVRSFSLALRIIRRSMLLLSAARIELKTTTLGPSALAALTDARDMPPYQFTAVILRPLLSLARFLATRSANELRLSAAAVSLPGSTSASNSSGANAGPVSLSSNAALASLIRLLLLTLSTYLVNADRLLSSAAEVHEVIYELVREGDALRKLADGLVRDVLGQGLDSLPLRPGHRNANASTRTGASTGPVGNGNISASLAADETVRSVGWSLALEPVLDAVDSKLASSRTVLRDSASVMKLIAELDLEALLGAASLVGAGSGSGLNATMVGPGLVPLSSPPAAAVGPGAAPASFSTFRDGFSSSANDSAASSGVGDGSTTGLETTLAPRVSALLDRGELDEAWFEEVEEGALAEVARVVAVDVGEMLPIQ
ncbi:unnamed protein product [Tilletia controversa]|uniref:Armadillo-like helical domain-containing protein n=1 Tax=Tilletia controversa TaxID=13291 RepID=A0A8X7MY00_9BASI|nr:hypothetical protein CF328_g3741 [Tilletia controversa]KAE8253886.1 hypothetical protein A4X06_0g1169 [Tilletia controversa]CAD6906507.1 unnamed protein product [Tilletia controversa]CAD6912075.1 unnamed protein product [Tilletia controversa]